MAHFLASQKNKSWYWRNDLKYQGLCFCPELPGVLQLEKAREEFSSTPRDLVTFVKNLAYKNDCEAVITASLTRNNFPSLQGLMTALFLHDFFSIVLNRWTDILSLATGGTEITRFFFFLSTHIVKFQREQNAPEKIFLKNTGDEAMKAS